MKKNCCDIVGPIACAFLLMLPIYFLFRYSIDQSEKNKMALDDYLSRNCGKKPSSFLGNYVCPEENNHTLPSNQTEACLKIAETICKTIVESNVSSACIFFCSLTAVFCLGYGLFQSFTRKKKNKKLNEKSALLQEGYEMKMYS